MIRILIFLAVGILFVTESNAQERSSRRRRSFDPIAHLKSLDANSNGALEPSELSDRSKQFIQGLGFSTDEALSIEKIAAKINGDKAESEKAKQAEASGTPQRNVTRKVPGFGVEQPARQGVPDFVAKKQASESELKGKYGDRIMEQVEAAMERYDKNKDGKIDQSEASEGRWGQPEPKESDLDKDGNLTRQEMAERYYRRERNANQNEENRGNDSGRDSNRESSSRGNRDSERNSERASSRGSESENNRDAESSNDSKDSSGEPPRQPAGDRYRRYADQLIEQYDKDKDGNLSKEEMGEMKQRPENADLDGNGTISAAELTEAIANGNMSSGSKSGGNGSTTPAPSSGRSSRSESQSNSSSRDSDSGSSRNSSRSSAPFSFNASDKGGDGQVQMHEFASEWTDEKLEEFRSYDLNGDGVITSAEFRERKK